MTKHARWYVDRPGGQVIGLHTRVASASVVCARTSIETRGLPEQHATAKASRDRAQELVEAANVGAWLNSQATTIHVGDCILTRRAPNGAWLITYPATGSVEAYGSLAELISACFEGGG